MSGFYSFHCGCFCFHFKTLILGIINVLPIIRITILRITILRITILRITILRIMSLFFYVQENVYESICFPVGLENANEVSIFLIP